MAASVDVHGPGIMPGSVKLQTFSDAYLSWMHSNVGLQRQPGFVHVTVRLPLGALLRPLGDLRRARGV